MAALSIKQSDLTLTSSDKALVGTSDSRAIEFGHFHSPRAEIDTLYVVEIEGGGSTASVASSTVATILMNVTTPMWDQNNDSGFNTSQVQAVFTRTGNIVTVLIPAISADSVLEYTGDCSISIFPDSLTIEEYGMTPAIGANSDAVMFSMGSSGSAITYDGTDYVSELFMINAGSPSSPAYEFVIANSLTGTTAGKSMYVDPIYFTYYATDDV